MKEHIELFINAAKEFKFGALVVKPADYLLKLVELKMKQGEQRLTEDELRKMKEVLDGQMGNTITITTEKFMGEEILRDWLDTEKGDNEARRYCLVNGLIPYNAENIKGLPDFYIDAEHLPEDIQAKLLKIAEAGRGEFVDEVETGERKIVKTELEGAWICDGEVKDFKARKERRIEVTTFYNYPE